jgi:predicted PurR-regulated permease PerM
MILLELDRLKVRAAALIPPAIRSDTVELIQDVSNVFVRYLRGVSIVLVYYAILAAVVLTMLGAPYALLLAAVFALVYLIPYLGPIINVSLLVLLTGMSGRTENMFFEMANPWSFAIAIAGIFFAIFLLFDPLVYTRIVGNSVGLHPLVSFFVVFSGAALFGPAGMILAFPVAGSVKIILDRLLKITSNSQELQLPSVPLRHRQT